MAFDVNSLFKVFSDNILVFAVIGAIAYIIYILYKRGSKDQKYLRKNVEKEIRKDLNYLYGIFYNPVNKQVSAGLVKVGHVYGYMVLYWDKNATIKKNLKTNTQLQKYLKAHPEKKDEQGKLAVDLEEMYLFKMRKMGRFAKLKGFLGLGLFYTIIPSKLVKNTPQEININPTVQPDEFYSVVYYGHAAREWIENIPYKLTREGELEEFVNQSPKASYLEVALAGAVARDRERAEIEKQKYKGQVEAAESG